MNEVTVARFYKCPICEREIAWNFSVQIPDKASVEKEASAHTIRNSGTADVWCDNCEIEFNPSALDFIRQATAAWVP